MHFLADRTVLGRMIQMIMDLEEHDIPVVGVIKKGSHPEWPRLALHMEQFRGRPCGLFLQWAYHYENTWRFAHAQFRPFTEKRHWWKKWKTGGELVDAAGGTILEGEEWDSRGRTVGLFGLDSLPEGVHRI